MSTATVAVPFTFPGEPGPVSVTVAGEYIPGSPATGFSGPPENYDPGDPARFEVETVLVAGRPFRYEEFEAELASRHGETEGERVLYDLLEAARVAYEDLVEAKAPDWGDYPDEPPPVED